MGHDDGEALDMSAARSWTPADAGAGPATPPPPGATILPFGTTTGMSKQAELRLAECRMAGELYRFLMRAHALAFGNAGHQARAGVDKPGTRAEYRHGDWARALQIDPGNLTRLRHKAVATGIVSYEEGETPGHGDLVWCLDFDQWLPLQDAWRRARYTRDGAGRPRQSNVQRLDDCQDEYSNTQRPAAIQVSNVQRPPATEVFLRTTPASSEAGRQAARRDPEESVPEKKDHRKEIPPVGRSADASAPAEVAPGSLALPKDWPALQPGEEPRALYRRALVVCPNKPAMATYALHLILGTPNTRQTLTHLAALHRDMARAQPNTQMRWGLILAAALDTAAKDDLIADPLDYCHKRALALAAPQAARAARNGAPGGYAGRGVPTRHYMAAPERWDERMATQAALRTKYTGNTGGTHQ